MGVEGARPVFDKSRVSATLTAVLAGIGPALLGVQFEAYRTHLFVGTPFAVALIAALADAWSERRSFWQCVVSSLMPLWFLALFLLALGIEGLLCLGMAAVAAIPVAIVGGCVGFLLQRHRTAPGVLLGAFVFVPIALLVGPHGPDTSLDTVTTSIVIAAGPETVWKYVPSFPNLAPPREFLFRAGIAYPVATRIEGSGPGAARQCVLSTGTMTERVTAWEPGRRLQFDVLSTPPTMKELSPWPNLDPPHLHGFYVSKRGEFRLIALPDGRTLLEGQSWYQHGLGPVAYWNVWTRYIVHQIHGRVLTHIKALAEADSGSERVASAPGQKSDRLRLRVRE